MSPLESDGCGDCEIEDGDEASSWDEDSLPSYSDSSCLSRSNQADRLGGPDPGHASNMSYTSSTASTSSTVSYLNHNSYSTLAHSGVSSISPRRTASRQPSGSPSEPSTDPILLQFASHSDSTSLARQVSWATADSDTVSGSEGLSSLEEDERADTPDTNTSEGDLVDHDLFDPDEATTVLIPNGREAFLGLELSGQ
jgi:hypothetical protein